MNKVAVFFRSLVLFIFGCVTVSTADTLTLGFGEFPREINLFESAHPISQFARSGFTDTLLTEIEPKLSDPAPKILFKLRLADSVNVSPDRSKWSFRVKQSATFHNANPVAAEDVVYSMERCRQRGLLPQLKSVVAHRKELVSDRPENWVEFEVLPSQSGFPLVLAQCPILEEQSSKIFGKDLGFGSNLVSAGPYKISDFETGKSITLARQHSLRSAAAATQDVVLRAFKDPNHSLTALRTGTVDALIDAEPSIVEKARQDDTLLISQCAAYMVIQRKGLQMQCEPRIDLSSIHYVS